LTVRKGRLGAARRRKTSPIGRLHCGARLDQEAGERRDRPAHSSAPAASFHTHPQTRQAALRRCSSSDMAPPIDPRATYPFRRLVSCARVGMIAAASRWRSDICGSQGGCGLGNPRLNFAYRGNCTAPRWGVTLVPPVHSDLRCQKAPPRGPIGRSTAGLTTP
jgi:hypothetical protein